MHALSAEEVSQRYQLRPRLLLLYGDWLRRVLPDAKKLRTMFLPALQLIGAEQGRYRAYRFAVLSQLRLSKFAAGLWHDSHGQRAFMGIGLLAIGVERAVQFSDAFPLLLFI